MKKLISFVWLCAVALGAMAQSSPNFYFGQTPTPTQWNAYFSIKQDYASPINGSTIGAITPMSGAFTSLSANSGLSVTGATSLLGNTSVVGVFATSGNATVGGTLTGGNGANLLLPNGSGNSSVAIWNSAGSGSSNLNFGSGGTWGTWSSTGLAVTGALSATGTFSGGTSGTGYSLSGSAPANSLTLDASGNLLIGQTAVGAQNINGIYLTPAAGGANMAIQHLSGTTSGTGYTSFNYNGAGIGSITQSGTTAVLYNTTSDRRLKKNIHDAAPASRLIDDIRIRSFDWKADDSHQRYGVIAQELYEVYPEAVSKPADPEQMMAVDYSKLTPLLVKELQDLRVRVHALELQGNDCRVLH